MPLTKPSGSNVTSSDICLSSSRMVARIKRRSKASETFHSNLAAHADTVRVIGVFAAVRECARRDRFLVERRNAEAARKAIRQRCGEAAFEVGAQRVAGASHVADTDLRIARELAPRRLGVDRDETRRGALAVQRILRAAQYLDAIDVEQLADGEGGAQAECAVDEHADRGLERADVAEVSHAA